MTRLKILLIEDDADDVELLLEALQANNVDCDVEVVTEGDKVFAYLEKTDMPPDAIIMDFNLPKLHGREILSLIRSSTFKNIPLMVLTTSASQDDATYALSMGASKFVTKPSTMQGFNTTVEAILSLVN